VPVAQPGLLELVVPVAELAVDAANQPGRPRRRAAGDPRCTTLLDNSHTHLTAEFIGVSSEQLRDAALLGGLLIAAANAAGFSPIGVPTVRKHVGDGVSAMLLLMGAHIVLHSIPERQTLLFDVVGPASHDFRKAVDVFARRLSARDIKSDTRGRG
jgi:S-adenosylmethionine/arginine decarboxylase-like enzyme